MWRVVRERVESGERTCGEWRENVWRFVRESVEIW